MQQSSEDQSHQSAVAEQLDDQGGGTAVEARPRTAPPRVSKLPPWNILLHNDDVNTIGYVVETIIELAAMPPQQALLCTLEADKSGVALLMTTHRERAELLCEQFMSKQLTVTMERA